MARHLSPGFGLIILGPSRLCSFSSYLPPLFTGQLALSRVTTELPQITAWGSFSPFFAIVWVELYPCPGNKIKKPLDIAYR